jgi:hypothetical protein
MLFTKAVPIDAIPNSSVVAGKNQPGPIHLHRIFAGISQTMYGTCTKVSVHNCPAMYSNSWSHKGASVERAIFFHACGINIL